MKSKHIASNCAVPTLFPFVVAAPQFCSGVLGMPLHGSLCRRVDRPNVLLSRALGFEFRVPGLHKNKRTTARHLGSSSSPPLQPPLVMSHGYILSRCTIIVICAKVVTRVRVPEHSPVAASTRFPALALTMPLHLGDRCQ